MRPARERAPDGRVARPSPSDPLVGDLSPAGEKGTDQGFDACSCFVRLVASGMGPELLDCLVGDDGGGGDEETRTPDPLLAKEMLCQLSYVPDVTDDGVVGVSGLEPETSALSGQCSNQLS